jgi:hypothetical protein
VRLLLLFLRLLRLVPTLEVASVQDQLGKDLVTFALLRGHRDALAKRGGQEGGNGGRDTRCRGCCSRRRRSAYYRMMKLIALYWLGQLTGQQRHWDLGRGRPLGGAGGAVVAGLAKAVGVPTELLVRFVHLVLEGGHPIVVQLRRLLKRPFQQRMPLFAGRRGRRSRPLLQALGRAARTGANAVVCTVGGHGGRCGGHVVQGQLDPRVVGRLHLARRLVLEARDRRGTYHGTSRCYRGRNGGLATDGHTSVRGQSGHEDTTIVGVTAVVVHAQILDR